MIWVFFVCVSLKIVSEKERERDRGGGRESEGEESETVACRQTTKELRNKDGDNKPSIPTILELKFPPK